MARPSQGAQLFVPQNTGRRGPAPATNPAGRDFGHPRLPGPQRQKKRKGATGALSSSRKSQAQLGGAWQEPGIQRGSERYKAKRNSYGNSEASGAGEGGWAEGTAAMVAGPRAYLPGLCGRLLGRGPGFQFGWQKEESEVGLPGQGAGGMGAGLRAFWSRGQGTAPPGGPGGTW